MGVGYFKGRGVQQAGKNGEEGRKGGRRMVSMYNILRNPVL